MLVFGLSPAASPPHPTPPPRNSQGFHPLLADSSYQASKSQRVPSLDFLPHRILASPSCGLPTSLGCLELLLWGMNREIRPQVCGVQGQLGRRTGTWSLDMSWTCSCSSLTCERGPLSPQHWVGNQH